MLIGKQDKEVHIMDIEKLFWEASVEEMVQGYIYEEEKEEYICLVCGECFVKGVIYKSGEVLLEAERAVKSHIAAEHNSMFDYLVNMDKKYTGLTEHQKKLLTAFKAGQSDKEIVEAEGEGSTSTIRNHRFKLKEREKQAKVFLAIMQSLTVKDDLINIHRGATMVDERYATTEEEREKVLKNYFSDSRLKSFPASEKKKIVILKQIMKGFDVKKEYSEKEVNEVLKSIFEDFVTIRRYLIQYGFMERTKDCSKYWVKR
jgi:hypothetical protein